MKVKLVKGKKEDLLNELLAHSNHFSTISDKVAVIYVNIWCLSLEKIDYEIEVSHKPFEN